MWGQRYEKGMKEQRKMGFSFVICSLIRTFAPDFKKTIKGCSRVWAEMIPSEPDTDNADAGMMSNTEQPLI